MKEEIADMDEVAQEVMEQQDTKACPACAETIKAAAIKCRFCGENLQKFQAAQEAGVEKELFVGHPAAIYTVSQWFWIVLTLGIAAIVYWVKSISTKFEITTQRVKIHKGILSKSKNTVELFRIDDFDLIHPFGMRLLGYGALQVKSSDRNVPNLYLYGIRDIDGLYEQLRECSLNERQRRGIKVWANA
jgi:hypothetical protein